MNDNECQLEEDEHEETGDNCTHVETVKNNQYKDVKNKDNEVDEVGNEYEQVKYDRAEQRGRRNYRKRL